MSEKIKIAIVDDERLITELLVNFFKSNDNIDVVYSTDKGKDFLKELEKATISPDLALLDLKMSSMSGTEITEALKEKHPDIKVIMITSYYDKKYTGHMLKLGVNAFIPKGMSLGKLTNVIEEVYSNDFFFLSEQMEALRTQISPKTPQPRIRPFEKLTKREQEILYLICSQYTTKEIADKLYITKRTVEGHRTNLLLKSDVKNTAGLIIWAIQNKIIDANELPLS